MTPYKRLRAALHPLRAFYVSEQWRFRDLPGRCRWALFGQLAPALANAASSGHKHLVVREYGRQYECHVLVETGTFLGDTVAACLSDFERIVSIELAPLLARRAQRRFRHWPHVAILRGDSADLLPAVLDAEPRRCLLWLDGHFSSGVTARGSRNTPVMDELRAVLSRRAPGHVILIDDARLFTGEGDYPTLAQVESMAAEAGLEAEVSDDIIRITPTMPDPACVLLP